MKFIPAQVRVDEQIRDNQYCREILSRLPKEIPVTFLPFQKLQINEENQTGIDSKPDILILTENKGPFLKPCPGTTANYLCCNYQILDIGCNCSMSCNYCALKTYYNFSQLTFYCNTAEMLKELDERLQNQNRPFLRIGTGEFTDSLCLDHITEFSKMIVPFIAEQNRCLLEFKTKTVQIENLLKLDPKQKVMVSFSLNARQISEKEEDRTASLEERLAASRKCEDAGYWLGFHFDPIVRNISDWEKEYHRTVDIIFDTVKNPKSIGYISLGCLRYQPEMNAFIKKTSPDSVLPYGEFILGNDHKMRYFKPLRIQVYRKMNEWIKKRSADTPVYLCMESPTVWKEALGIDAQCDADVAKILEQKLKNC